MKYIIILINRLEKVIGTVFKILSYAFHFFFPKKRFTIPKYSKPLIKSKKETKIPKIIWQTNYTNKVSLPVYLNYLFNRLMSLDWEYRYVSTEEREEYIKTNASERYYNAFSKLNDGAAQADFWRVFVLNTIGGVYLDIDAHFVWPLSKMIPSDANEVILMSKKWYSNYFIASTKNNPHLEKNLEIIVENIEKKRFGKGGVYDLTGPKALNMAINETQHIPVISRNYRITCMQGNFTNEYFQYIDKPRGKWTYKENKDLLK
jgi:mannosyltransferase OCH1-like enzyme